MLCWLTYISMILKRKQLWKKKERGKDEEESMRTHESTRNTHTYTLFCLWFSISNTAPPFFILPLSFMLPAVFSSGCYVSACVAAGTTVSCCHSYPTHCSSALFACLAACCLVILLFPCSFYLSGTNLDEFAATPALPCLTGLYVTANSPK